MIKAKRLNNLKLLKEKNLNKVTIEINTLNLNLEGINNGVYFINFINNSSKSTKKFVISR